MSHETISRSLYVQSGGSFRPELTAHPRGGRGGRKWHVRLPEKLHRSKAWGQMKEMAQQAPSKLETSIPVYSASPRVVAAGANESATGFLRKH